jgi:hypothetical protein
MITHTFEKSIQRVVDQAKQTMANAAAGMSAASDLDAALMAGVSPEGILAVVGKRLREMDSQIASQLEEINSNSGKAKEISDQLKALYKLKEHAKTKHDGYSEKSVSLDATKEVRPKDLIEDNGELISVREYIERHDLGDLLSTFETMGKVNDGSGKMGEFDFVSVGEIETTIEVQKQTLTDVNSGNELRMIALQSVMQQRTQVITLGTNLMKSLHEASEGVIRNIG